MAITDDMEIEEGGGADVAEIEILQIIAKACETAIQNINAFKVKMVKLASAVTLYNNALDIYCAEQIAYWFGEYVNTLDDDEKLKLFDDEQLTVLAQLNEQGLVIPRILSYIMDCDRIAMTNMDDIEDSIKTVLMTPDTPNKRLTPYLPNMKEELWM